MSGKNNIGENLAIVPVEREEFDFIEATSSQNILGALNFIGPSKTEGYAFWRVPQVYNKKEVQSLSKIISTTLNGISEVDGGELDDEQVKALMMQSTGLIDSAHMEFIKPDDEIEIEKENEEAPEEVGEEDAEIPEEVVAPK